MSPQEEFISAKDYARLCDLIYAEAGIHLNLEKKTMLEARVKRRLKILNIATYSLYCDYLFGHKGLKNEISHLIDVVTTNKTDFFRESKHFEYLTAKAIPDLMSRDRSGRPLLVWSAGCSTGEEPYTLAIVLCEYALTHPGFRFRVLGTDISTIVLESADRGVYTAAVVAPVPAKLKLRYFMRSRDRSSDKVRVSPELRRMVEFRHLNFMDADYGISEKVDAIFCRNVIIYFDRPTQKRIVNRLANHLIPEGYMFVGHSETLHDMNLPLKQVAPALYKRVDTAT